MKNLFLILDYINLKYLFENISAFARKSGDKRSNISDCKKIISVILDEVCVNSFDNSKVQLKIQKYLSSENPTRIQIIDDINTGNWDKELESAISIIYDDIALLPDYISLIHDFFEHCIKPHFTDEEYSLVQKSFQCREYNKTLFLLFKHAFNNYQQNLPGLLSKRLYEEAVTSSISSEMRYNLFKESADLGNNMAALEYAEFMCKKDLEVAIRYYIKAFPTPPGIWSIGTLLESGSINENQYTMIVSVPLIKKTIMPYFEQAKNVCPFSYKNLSSEHERQCIELAFAIFYYLSEGKEHFSKALNSVGKLLINQIIIIKSKNAKESSKLTIEMGVKYLQRAIRLGNSNAMVNLAAYYIKEKALGKQLEKENYIISLLEVAASLGELTANVMLADIYIKRKQTYIAKDFLKFAHEHDNAAASHKLGEILESEGDSKSAINYYKTAVKRGYADSAFNIALFYTADLIDNSVENIMGIKPNIIYIKELLRKSIPRMSPEVAMKSSAYVLYLDNILSE